MGDVFQEVDEDVRRDLYIRLWRAYGRYVIAGLVLLVVGVAAGVGWTEYREQRMQAEGARFAAAVALLDQGRASEAARAFAGIADDAGAGYAALARLREATALIASGDRAGAIAIYDRVAAGGGDRQLRDVAALLASIQVLNGGGADLEARLAPLAEGAGYWRHLARELQAIAALKRGGRAEAKDIFSVLAEDADAPAGVRRRAAEMIARIGGGPSG